MAAIKILLGVALLTIVPWSSAVIPSVNDKVPSTALMSTKPSEPSILFESPVPTVSSVPTTSSVSTRSSVSAIPSEPTLPTVPSVSAIPSESTLRSVPSASSQPSESTLISIQPEPLIPSIPDVPEFNFNLIQTKAQVFYETLPQTILDDAKMMVPELIKKYGYPCETHKVTTPDGYILSMHRIPHGRTGPSENRSVVYLQHGVLSSSADWVVPGPEKGLGYILADAGYDVWIPNARGTRYSRSHVSLDPDSAKFWDFSWHEIAVFDVTTMIDYALNKTKQKKLFYVGHSQGTTVFYVMCSEKPEYNDKIRAQFSLAPIAYMSHMTSPLLKIFSVAGPGVGVVLQLVGVNEFVPNTGFLGRVGKLLCSDDSATQILCTNSLFAVCGFNQKQMNATLLPVIMGHTLAGSSTKQILHYSQEINSGKFRQYDYGILGNVEKYGTSEIPRYQLNNVTAPVYLFYSQNDWLSGVRDVERLYVELGNVQDKLMVADSEFNHIDYLYAIHARELVYDSLIKLMEKH